MDNQQATSRGLEKLIFLADKAQRLIHQLDHEVMVLRGRKQELASLKAECAKTTLAILKLEKSLVQLSKDKREIYQRIDRILETLEHIQKNTPERIKARGNTPNSNP